MARPLHLLTLILVALALGGAPFCVADGLSDIQKQQLQVHQTILSKLQAYNPDQQFKMVYGLIAKANERDRERNLKYVENLVAKAEEVRRKGQGQGQEYLKMAHGYKAIADVNQKVVKGFAAGDREAMDKALTELQGICAQVEKATGKAVLRDWFTPDESEGYALGEMLKRQRKE